MSTTILRAYFHSLHHYMNGADDRKFILQVKRYFIILVKSRKKNSLYKKGSALLRTVLIFNFIFFIFLLTGHYIAYMISFLLDQFIIIIS